SAAPRRPQSSTRAPSNQACTTSFVCSPGASRVTATRRLSPIAKTYAECSSSQHPDSSRLRVRCGALQPLAARLGPGAKKGATVARRALLPEEEDPRPLFHFWQVMDGVRMLLPELGVLLSCCLIATGLL